MKVLTQLIISFHSIIFSRLKLENNSFIRPSHVLHFAKHLTSPYWIKNCAEVDFETMIIVEERQVNVTYICKHQARYIDNLVLVLYKPDSSHNQQFKTTQLVSVATPNISDLRSPLDRKPISGCHVTVAFYNYQTLLCFHT